MADNRVRRTAGKPAVRAKAAPAGQRARKRIAAERAARRRAEARRRFLIAAGAITGVLAIVVALVVVKLTAAPAHRTASESMAPATIVQQVTTVPAATLAQVGPGQAVTLLEKVKNPAPLLTMNGKPAVVFISEESCPFCAAERWAVTVALSQFGTWSQLGITKSSATDIYPNTATLSFRTARYRSADLTLSTTELADNAGHALQPQTALDSRVIASYDVPPYVNSVDQSGAVPFLDIGNQYVLAGAQYNPQVLAGLSAAQIARQLSTPSSPVAQAVDGAAKVIVAAINQVLHTQAGHG